MSTVEEIAEAIAGLPKEEFWKLTDKLVSLRNEFWDQQMEEGKAAGRLDALWRVAESEIASGEAVSLDEFLRHEELPK